MGKTQLCIYKGQGEGHILQILKGVTICYVKLMYHKLQKYDEMGEHIHLRGNDFEICNQPVTHKHQGK